MTGELKYQSYRMGFSYQPRPEDRRYEKAMDEWGRLYWRDAGGAIPYGVLFVEILYSKSLARALALRREMEEHVSLMLR